MREKWGRFKGEFGAKFFRNSRRTRLVFMAKTNTTMRTEETFDDSCVEYMVHLHKKAGQFKDIMSTGQLVK